MYFKGWDVSNCFQEEKLRDTIDLTRGLVSKSIIALTGVWDSGQDAAGGEEKTPHGSEKPCTEQCSWYHACERR